MLLTMKKKEWLGNTKNDTLSGLVTAIALIPEVIGFAIIAGVNPITALFASVSTAIITSLTSGRPAMVSAAAGSMALIMVSIIRDYGIEYMIAATILTGFIQLALGYLGIHKLMKFISKPVMLGFVNALAILIFLAQVQQLGNANGATFIVVIASILAMFLIPKFFKAIPPALIVIVLTTLVAVFSPVSLQTVGDLGDMSGILPTFAFPIVPFTFETLRVIFPVAIALSMVGLIESLLTLPLVDEMTGTHGDNQREVKSQGLANIITGFLGGPAGCAMIGQSVINVKSGGRKRLSTMVAGLSLLLLIVVFKDIMVQIPTAALIGIMITVAYDTFDWGSVKHIHKIPVTETLTMLVTVAIVVYTHNLAIGVSIGVLLNILIFTVKVAKLKIHQQEDIIIVDGLLFFVSINHLNDYFKDLDLTHYATIDFSRLYILDETSQESLNELVTTLEKRNPAIIIK